MLNFTKELIAKGIEMFTLTIDSPIKRLSDNTIDSKTGQPMILKSVIYSNKKIDIVKGKVKLAKGQNAFTANQAEADALGISVGKTPKSAMVNGKRLYFNTSKLTPDERKIISNVGGVDLAKKRLIKIKKAIESLDAVSIMGLPKDQREWIANFLAETATPVMDKLRRKKDETVDDTSLFDGFIS